MRAFKRPDAIPIGDAATRLGCSVRTLQRIAKEGRISFVRRGRYAYVLREDLARLEVDGHTEWLVDRLCGADADSMLVAEWFRNWIELQRLSNHASDHSQTESAVTAAEHVIEHDGTRPMAEYGVTDLAASLESSGLTAGEALGLRILARWPGGGTLLSAYRTAARSLVGWTSPPDAPPSRKGRLRSGPAADHDHDPQG